MLRFKLGKLTVSWGDKCSRERCTYFTHYLRQGPGTLPHAAYHIAEEECLTWQRRAEDYLALDHDVPNYVEAACQRLEAEVRA